jgi:hypothetical protein
MTAEPPWHRTHLAVPRTDESLLAIPDLDESAAAAREKAQRLDGCDVEVQGRSLSRLRREARREAVLAASDFTHGILGDTQAAAGPDAPLVVPGHQPALYHPGVWVKNFAAAGIAKRIDGAVLNLIVDNDLYSRGAIEVPAGTRLQPSRETVAFDASQKPRPWERTKIVDRQLFRSFADRVSQKLDRFGIDPLIAPAWPAAIRRLELCGSLPE